MDRDIQIGEKTYKLRFANKFIRKFEEMHDKSIGDVMHPNGGFKKTSDLLDVIYCGLQHNDDPPSFEEFEDNFHLSQIEKCLQVLNEDMGGDLEMETEPSGQDQKKKSAGKRGGSRKKSK